MHTFYPYIKKEIKINQFEIYVDKLVLFESVEIRVCLYSDDDKPMDWRYYVLSGDDYKNWSNDDGYLVKYVKLKLRKEQEQDLPDDFPTFKINEIIPNPFIRQNSMDELEKGVVAELQQESKDNSNENLVTET